MKYHIDKNGKPAKCTASVGSCPYGESNVHFDNIESAQEFADKMNAVQFGILKVTEEDRIKEITKSSNRDEDFRQAKSPSAYIGDYLREHGVISDTWGYGYYNEHMNLKYINEDKIEYEFFLEFGSRYEDGTQEFTGVTTMDELKRFFDNRHWGDDLPRDGYEDLSLFLRKEVGKIKDKKLLNIFNSKKEGLLKKYAPDIYVINDGHIEIDYNNEVKPGNRSFSEQYNFIEAINDVQESLEEGEVTYNFGDDIKGYIQDLRVYFTNKDDKALFIEELIKVFKEV